MSMDDCVTRILYSVGVEARNRSLRVHFKGSFLSPFFSVEVLGAFQLARAALVARAWPEEVYEME